MRGMVLNIESLESQVFRAILPCAGEDSGHSPSTDADSGLEQESLTGASSSKPRTIASEGTNRENRQSSTFVALRRSLLTR